MEMQGINTWLYMLYISEHFHCNTPSTNYILFLQNGPEFRI